MEPLLGWQFTQEYPHLNSSHFQAFLNALKAAVGWRHSNNSVSPRQGFYARFRCTGMRTRIPIFQPSHSPQLNTTERLWQFLKAQLHGDSFQTLNYFKIRVQYLLKELMQEQVASPTSYNFILEAWFYRPFRKFSKASYSRLWEMCVILGFQGSFNLKIGVWYQFFKNLYKTCPKYKFMREKDGRCVCFVLPSCQIQSIIFISTPNTVRLRPKAHRLKGITQV